MRRKVRSVIRLVLVMCVSSWHVVKCEAQSSQPSATAAEEQHSEVKAPSRALVPVPSSVLEGLKRSKSELWTRASQAIDRGRFTEAAQALRDMTTLDPEDATSRMNLGAALARAGDRKAAVEEYSAALRIAPDNATAHSNLGAVLIELGSEQEAIEHFQAAIKSDPKLQGAHFQLANLLMRKGRYSEAMVEYAAVIKMEPRNGFARLMETMALVRLKEYSKARVELEQGLVVLPDDADLAIALARLLAACPDKSVRDGPRALGLIQGVVKPQESFDLEQGQTVAMALAETGQFRKAAELQRFMIAELERAQQLNLARLLRENLTLYESEKACRVPWRDDDPIFSPVPATPTGSAEFSSPTATAGQGTGSKP